MLACDICGKKADQKEYCIRTTRDGFTYQSKKIDICHNCKMKLENQIDIAKCKILEDLLKEHEKTIEDLY